MEIFKHEILPKLHEKYNLVQDYEEENVIVMRAAISNAQEVDQFINELKLLTNTGWNYYYARKNPAR